MCQAGFCRLRLLKPFISGCYQLSGQIKRVLVRTTCSLPESLTPAIFYHVIRISKAWGKFTMCCSDRKPKDAYLQQLFATMVQPRRNIMFFPSFLLTLSQLQLNMTHKPRHCSQSHLSLTLSGKPPYPLTMDLLVPRQWQRCLQFRKRVLRLPEA